MEETARQLPWQKVADEAPTLILSVSSVVWKIFIKGFEREWI